MKMSSLVFDTAQSNNPLDLFTMAETADRCGWERFWLGEHYERQNLWNNPEPLIPIILGLTERINVGAAGILLKLHSPYRIASSFKLMNMIFPDRVDLGLASGYANKETNDYLLNQGSPLSQTKEFYNLIHQLTDFYSADYENHHNSVIVNPSMSIYPRMWLLSSGFNRFEESIKYKLNYSMSIFHTNAQNKVNLNELHHYREKYYNKFGEIPITNLAFAGIITHNDKETKEMKQKINEISRFTFITPNIIGTPSFFQDQLNEYTNKFDMDDFTFLDLSYDLSQRIDNIEILSDILDLRKKA